MSAHGGVDLVAERGADLLVGGEMLNPAGNEDICSPGHRGQQHAEVLRGAVIADLERQLVEAVEGNLLDTCVLRG
jgi:hypothetical protein